MENKIVITEIKYELQLIAIREDLLENRNIRRVTLLLSNNIDMIWYGRTIESTKLLNLYFDKSDTLIGVSCGNHFSIREEESARVLEPYDEDLIFIGIESKEDFYNKLIKSIKKFKLETALEK